MPMLAPRGERVCWEGPRVDRVGLGVEGVIEGMGVAGLEFLGVWV